MASRNIILMRSPKAPNKHQLKSDATRTALLKAAEAVFARDGYERAQIDEIAKDSGRTRGAVYSQYKTKEQLFFAVQEQQLDNTRKRVTTALAKHQNGADDALAALKEYYADLHDANTAILDLELKLYAIRNTASRDEWRKQYNRVYQVDNIPAFTEAFGISEEPGRSHIRSRLLALIAFKSGLILAMRSMPEEFTQKEVKLLLKEIFDGLFPAFGKSAPSQSKTHVTKASSTLNDRLRAAL